MKLDSIDWASLRSQKMTLLQVIGISRPTVAEDLQAIVHLIDALQDEAAAVLGDVVVFGEVME